MDSKCSLTKCHSCHAIVLRYHNISSVTNAYQLIVNSICHCTNYNHFTVIGIQHVIGIAQQCSGNIIFSAIVSTMSTTGNASASTNVCISSNPQFVQTVCTNYFILSVVVNQFRYDSNYLSESALLLDFRLDHKISQVSVLLQVLSAR